MSKRFVAMLAAVAALAMLIGGCGSSDDDSLTKAEFIKQGDAICTQRGKELQKQYEALAKTQKADKSSASSLGREFVETIFVPGIEKEMDSLRALSPPSGDEEKITAILKAAEAGVKEAKADPENLFGQKEYAFDELNELAAKYGFKACSAT